MELKICYILRNNWCLEYFISWPRYLYWKCQTWYFSIEAFLFSWDDYQILAGFVPVISELWDPNSYHFITALLTSLRRNVSYFFTYHFLNTYVRIPLKWCIVLSYLRWQHLKFHNLKSKSHVKSPWARCHRTFLEWLSPFIHKNILYHTKSSSIAVDISSTMISFNLIL